VYMPLKNTKHSNVSLMAGRIFDFILFKFLEEQ